MFAQHRLTSEVYLIKKILCLEKCTMLFLVIVHDLLYTETTSTPITTVESQATVDGIGVVCLS